MKHILSYSGGKDGTAMYLLAMERGFDFVPVFADTGNEHEETLEYVARLPERTGGPAIRWVKADFAEDFARKRAFVAAKWPADLMADVPGGWELRPEFVDDDADGSDESSRPDLPEPPSTPPADPFRPAATGYYIWRPARRGLSEAEAAARVATALELLQPTGVPFLDLCMVKGRFPSTKARFCSEELKHRTIFYEVVDPLLTAGHAVVSWQGVRADESERRAKLPRLERLGGGLFNYRPLLHWKAAEVFAMHRRHGLAPNPLYRQGCGRVGCMPCIHARKEELRNIGVRWPHHVDRLRRWERLVSDCSKRGLSTFFSADKTPGAHLKDITMPMPSIDDVMAWARTGKGGRQFDFAGLIEPPQCSSIYGLCE